MPYYANPKNVGIISISSLGDGYSMEVKWHTAYPDNLTNKIAYNIYYSTIEDDVFSEGPKFVSFDGTTQADLYNFVPGQLYHFAVRAIEYDPNIINLSLLPSPFSGLAIYPESLLSQNITSDQTTIPLLDISEFPDYGIIKAGAELIEYLGVDRINNDLIVPNGSAASQSVLIAQGDGYYSAISGNIGDGYINNLTLLDSTIPTETFTIKCISIEQDGAKFVAIGSISGIIRDGYTNPIVWASNNIVVSSNILSFSIQEGLISFVDGDAFLIKIQGPIDQTFGGRGFYNTIPRIHNTDGYDGYSTLSPIISYWLSDSEELNNKIYPVQSHFEFFQDQYAAADGYHQITKDILTTDLEVSDNTNVNFNSYDYAGWRRRDPTQLLNGECVGSYIGGYQFCADGYNSVGQMVRGLSFQERNNQREEILINVTGEPIVLLQRQWTGIVCRCVMASGEYPDDRCPYCLGGKYVLNWNQYRNPRRSDGRLMMRFAPADDKVVQYDSGQESEMFEDVWTLTVPTIKQRDIVIRFDQADNEEFRYEVINVSRNRIINRLSGAQKLRLQRIRKSDVAYQISAFRNTHFFPQIITSSITSIPGIVPHTHTIEINETFQNGAAQLTSISQGHNHIVELDKNTGQFIIREALGHIHDFVYNYQNNGQYVFR